MLAFGIVAPVFAPLVVRLEGGDTAAAAGMLGLFAAAWALMQFVCSPIQGALSDRFGRRPVILLSNLGLGLDFILMAVAQTLPLLFLGLGFIIAPAIGGMLGAVGTRAPFWVAAALSLTNFCYGLFVLPESLPKER